MPGIVDTAWEWVTLPTVPLPLPLTIVSLLIGAVAAVSPRTWLWFRSSATWLHEAGHAIAALLTGRSVTGIRVNADSSGTTEHVGARSGPGIILTAFAGYPAPIIAAYGIVAGLAAGKYHLVAGIMILSVAILFPLHRNVRGFWWALLYLGFSASLIILPQTGGQVALLILAGFLAAATPRTIIVLHRARAQQKNSLGDEPVHSDADSLSHMTGVPAIVWEGVFLAVTGVFFWLIVLAVGTPPT